MRDAIHEREKAVVVFGFTGCQGDRAICASMKPSHEGDELAASRVITRQF